MTTHTPARDREGLGHNDPDGTVHCHLCDWSHFCRSMELIEFHLGNHLWKCHGVKLKHRVDDENGKLTEIPQ